MASFGDLQTRNAARASLRCFDFGEVQQFVSLCGRRPATEEPIQHVISEWDFHHVNLSIRPVLIPQLETERLVDIVLSRYKSNDRLRVVDIGCSSEAVVLGLLYVRPKWTATAIGISPNAIDLTSLNATRLNQSFLSVNALCMGSRFRQTSMPTVITGMTDKIWSFQTHLTFHTQIWNLSKLK